MSNQVATQNQQRALSPEQFKQELVLAKTTIEKMLPSTVKFDEFEGMVYAVVSSSPKLLACTQPSLLKAVIDSANCGLSLNPVFREADILPVWNPKGTVAQFRPRAIGYMKLARQSGEIVSISAHEVYEKDIFEYEYGLEDKLRHVPSRETDRGPITHAYCVWKLKDGTKQFEVIDRVRIDRSRGASEGYKYAVENNKTNSVWHLHEGEMCRKTAVRMASKYFPMSNENKAFLLAMAAEDAIDGDFEEVENDIGVEEAAPSAAGVSQVAQLEQKLGVTASPQQGSAAPQITAPAAAVSQAPIASQSSPQPSDISSQANNQNGGATTASRSRKKAEPKQDGPSSPTPPPAEEGGAPMAELKGDDLGPSSIDWRAEAMKLRDGIAAVGEDLTAWSAFISSTKTLRDSMKKASPDWYARVERLINDKEAWLRG